MVGRGQRTDQNYFHCLAARDWGHTRATSLRYAVKGERTGPDLISRLAVYCIGKSELIDDNLCLQTAALSCSGWS